MENSQDSAFLRTALLVIGGLFAITFAIIMMAGVLGGDITAGSADEQTARAEITQRIAPVGKVITDPAALIKVSNASAAHPQQSGEQIVAQVCSGCHVTGMLGAPRIGDKAAWGQRLKTEGGLDGLLANALKGKNSMPPRGGNSDLSDAEVKSAIEHMLKQTGV